MTGPHCIRLPAEPEIASAGRVRAPEARLVRTPAYIGRQRLPEGLTIAQARAILEMGRFAPKLNPDTGRMHGYYCALCGVGYRSGGMTVETLLGWQVRHLSAHRFMCLCGKRFADLHGVRSHMGQMKRRGHEAGHSHWTESVG